MRTMHRFLAALPLILVASSSGYAADLFVESFDSAATAHIGTNNGTGVSVTYVDYSSMVVGALTHNIPEAPRQIPGSAPRRGVLLKVDYTAAFTERIANLVALDDVGGSRLPFSDNYRLKFDVYSRLSPNVTLSGNGFPNETGTTEQVLWGVGYTATMPMARSFRTTRGSGMWGWLATEGGHSAANGADASLYKGPTLISGRNMDTVSNADLAPYFTPAFGADASPVPYCPANQWVEASISVQAGQVTVEYRGAGRTLTKFFENVAGAGFVAGGAMVGYEDSFASVSFDPDNQWMLLDNMIVEDLTPPTMVVTPVAPLVTYTGTPRVATFSISNLRASGALTVSAIDFSGANAADFRILNPLPMVVPANGSAILQVQFAPAAPNGIKSVTVTVRSDDPQQPAYVIADLRARRSVGTFLEARYGLDETAGTSLTDSSGNGVTGTLQVRDPVVFGKPSLLGAADAGTAMGFLPAQTGTSGNYFVTSIVHTPSFSVAMWIKPAAAGLLRTLFQRDFDFAAPYEKICGLQLTTDGTLKYRVRSTDVISSATPVADDTVWHVVVTHLDTDGFGNTTADRCRIYLNGLKVAETPAGPAPGFDDYSLSPVVSGMHFGSRTSAGAGFSGCMDDVQIYGEELTPEQVWDVYRRPGVSALNSPLFQTQMAAGPGFTVSIPSSPSGIYTLMRSADLQTWEAAASATDRPGDPAALMTSLTDNAPGGLNRFYRVDRR